MIEVVEAVTDLYGTCIHMLWRVCLVVAYMYRSTRKHTFAKRTSDTVRSRAGARTRIKVHSKRSGITVAQVVFVLTSASKVCQQGPPAEFLVSSAPSVLAVSRDRMARLVRLLGANQVASSLFAWLARRLASHECCSGEACGVALWREFLSVPTVGALAIIEPPHMAPKRSRGLVSVSSIHAASSGTVTS